MTAPLSVAGAAFGWERPQALGALVPWLAAIPDPIGMFPSTLLLAVGALLVVGLGTRSSAVVLLLVIPIRQIGMAFDGRLCWTLLLGILACRCPGRLALDRWVAAMLAALERTMVKPTTRLPHVVIVGGGFGGVTAAQALKAAPCRITLLD